jgi:hypothetical protein
MQFIRCALQAFQIVAKRSYDCLFHGVGFLCHTRFQGCFVRNSPVSPFWKLGALESTPQPYRCAQLLLNQQEQ